MKYQMKWSYNQNDWDKFKLGPPFLSAIQKERNKTISYFAVQWVDASINVIHFIVIL